MQTNSRRLERLTLAALFAIPILSLYYWDFVHKAFQKTHNTLGQTNVHVPTADLFLWSVFALGIYFGCRFWANVGPKIFAMPAGRVRQLTVGLQAVRVVSTFALLGLTLNTIHTYVPDFIDKLPWP